jgi:arylsulfatase
MWLFVPTQQKIREFCTGFREYPYQMGSSLNTAGISYQTIKIAEILVQLDGNLSPVLRTV